MSLPDPWPAILLGARDLVTALLPAALGSAVAQAWKTGLDWRQRLIQWLVGILVSYYVTLGVGAWLGFGPFVAQAVGFVVAMIAFETAPKIIAGCSETAAKIPQFVGDIVAKWTR